MGYNVPMSKFDDAVRDAGSAEGERLWAAIRLQHPPALLSATYNRALTEDMALLIAKSRSAPAEALGFLASDVRFKKVYKLQLALVRNPRTPLRVALTLMKFIKLFDLADLTRSPAVSSVTRQKVEGMLAERVPSLPAGVNIALSRRVNSTVLMAILQKGTRQVVDACLESARLTEEQVRNLVLRHDLKPHVVRAVAEHGKWATRYLVRYALVRNRHTPTGVVRDCIEALKTRDLKDLYHDEGVPPSNRPFIHAELMSRAETADPAEDGVHEIDEPIGIDEDCSITSAEFEALAAEVSEEPGDEDAPDDEPEEY